MHFDVAAIVIWIFELSLDQEIRAVRVIRILLGFERGLVVVAIAEDRSGYVAGMKVRSIPLNYTANSSKPIAIPVDFETALPRFRRGTHCGGQHGGFSGCRGRLEASAKKPSAISTRSCPSRRLRRTAEMGVDSGPSGVMSQRRGCADCRHSALIFGLRPKWARIAVIDGWQSSINPDRCHPTLHRMRVASRRWAGPGFPARSSEDCRQSPHHAQSILW